MDYLNKSKIQFNLPTIMIGKRTGNTYHLPKYQLNLSRVIDLEALPDGSNADSQRAGALLANHLIATWPIMKMFGSFPAETIESELPTGEQTYLPVQAFMQGLLNVNDLDDFFVAYNQLNDWCDRHQIVIV